MGGKPGVLNFHSLWAANTLIRVCLDDFVVALTFDSCRSRPAVLARHTTEANSIKRTLNVSNKFGLAVESRP